MTWTEPTRCAICGNTERRDLGYSLVHWRNAEPGMAYQHVEACLNRDACRDRVAAMGDPWPLIESTTRKTTGGTR